MGDWVEGSTKGQSNPAVSVGECAFQRLIPYRICVLRIIVLHSLSKVMNGVSIL
ncbi:hypothetical protein Ga0058931_0700 [Roseibaca calidilacus]|uniref:Uncharacterized protein n=1 Tax=Roseibaca calidilacus TaxID=1666912 RepID=A0ABP2BST3_9RHOB|nr:hypothetical protein Ga0058931_0700 [Roseibaca calidilacus]